MSKLRGLHRTEFPLAVRKKAFARCCKGGIPYCENCGIELRSGNIEYEHIVPDGLGGEPTVQNCGVWCRNCSKKKTHTEDRPRMAKADAVLKSSYGLQAKRQPIKSAGFRKARPQNTASRPLSRPAVERQR